MTDREKDSWKLGSPSSAVVAQELRRIRERAAQQRALARQMRADAVAQRERVRKSLGAPRDRDTA